MPSTCRGLQRGRGLRVLIFRRNIRRKLRDHKVLIFSYWLTSLHHWDDAPLLFIIHCPNESIKGPPYATYLPQTLGKDGLATFSRTSCNASPHLYLRLRQTTNPWCQVATPETSWTAISELALWKCHVYLRKRPIRRMG